MWWHATEGAPTTHRPSPGNSHVNSYVNWCTRRPLLPYATRPISAPRASFTLPFVALRAPSSPIAYTTPHVLHIFAPPRHDHHQPSTTIAPRASPTIPPFSVYIYSFRRIHTRIASLRPLPFLTHTSYSPTRALSGCATPRSLPSLPTPPPSLALQPKTGSAKCTR